MAYDLGDVVPLGVTVTDAGGTLVNAGSMALTITLPDDSTVTVTPVTPVSTGTYTYDYATTQAGRHLVRWLATGAYANAYTDVFDVREQTLVAIVSLADAKKQLNIDLADTSQDDELRGFITGASLAVERELGTIVARRSFTERRAADGDGQILLSNVPVLALVSAQSPDGATTWNVADLDVDSATGLVAAKTGAPLSGDVQFVYKAGLRIVPDDYQLATNIIIQHLWDTQRGKMGAVPGGGEEPTYMSGRGFALPRRALELLDTPLPGIA
ncbi:hypothetical protein [Streptomyces cylindrosporus]|uniref:Uncharacterized protein n=1 Tax=Streptomyces cylindrosporus TaxID=2927583 RepID=A0ABS9YK11_9ACTN|nr:hypothetical protein [Streptomyces cylindrosporus]MCI3277524.1 hypothetical protein [Streptomyces cylindrosporus]